MKKKQKTTYNIITVGGATRDIMFYSGEGELVKTGNMTKQRLLAFEYGAKILADKLNFSFGGGAANAAATFAALGLKTAFVSRVGGDDAGGEVLNNLKKRNISTEFVNVDKDSSTGFSLILTVDNAESEHIAFLHRGANNNLSAHDLPTISPAPWVYISSLPAHNWIPIVRKAISGGARIAWNPGSGQLQQVTELKKILPKIELFMVNRDEALEFKKLKDIKSLIKHIHALGPKIVVITDGRNGAYVYDGHKYYFMKARRTKSTDTIGVGDAFNAAFTGGIIYGKNVRQALGWGIKNAASVVSKIGAQNGILTKRTINT
jgi:sugar/nucleoside kinase (ribokinase family)